MSLNTVIPSNNSVQANQAFNGAVPGEGPKAIPYVFNFLANSGADIDLSNYKQTGRLSGIQSMFIDNSNNAGIVTITLASTQQQIKCPANAQAYFPVIMTSNLKFNIASVTAGIVNIQVMNFAMAATVWDTVSAGGGTIYPFVFAPNGALNTNENGNPTLTVDNSGTIVTGNVAVTAAPANTSRTRYRIQNIDTTGETLWFRDDGVAAVVGAIGNFALSGSATGIGGYAEGTSLQSISVIAATTGHKFTLKQDN